MKLTFKFFLLFSVLAGAFGPSRLYADDTMHVLFTKFESPDPDIRSVAFSSAIARPITEKKEAYEKALIGLLATEIAYAKATPITELQDDDAWNLYYINLITAVAKLHNSDSIPQLLQVMEKEDAVTQTLAGFGPLVVDRISAKVNDSNQAIRLAAVTVLFEMLNPENETKIVDQPVRNKIEAALKSVERDANPHIRNTAAEALKKLKTLKKPPESSYY